MDFIRGVHRYKVIQSLGKGGFGEAFLVEKIPTKEKKVFKKLNLLTHEEAKIRFRQEFLGIKKLHQLPGMLKVDELIEEDGLLGYIMEYVPHGFFEWLEKRRGKEFSLYVEILKVFAHLHNRFIAHRDIKPQNIRFRENGKPVVLDFGVAYWGVESITMQLYGEDKLLGVGTPIFLPPEILFLIKRFSGFPIAQKANAALININAELGRDILKFSRIVKMMHDVYSLGMLGLLIFNKELNSIYQDDPEHIWRLFKKNPTSFIRDAVHKIHIPDATTNKKLKWALENALSLLPDKRIRNAVELLNALVDEEIGVQNPETIQKKDIISVQCLSCGQYTPLSVVRQGTVKFCIHCGALKYHRITIYSAQIEKVHSIPGEFVQQFDDHIVLLIPYSQNINISVGRLHTNNIVIIDQFVSRQHFVLESKEDGIVVKNLKQDNPLRLEDIQLKAGEYHIVDKVSIGFGFDNVIVYDQIFQKQ